ncbi:alpha/beta hydrolase [Pedomonas sp. V897]|uniref:alpha/beta hydrolase n=1 Tax=Pedomonas sp. V897 TaxID=3446482 RepID=UPI003EE29362
MVRLAGLFLSVLLLMAQPAWAAPWELPRSDVIEMAAGDGHVYRVLVAWPEGEPPAAGWPVLWMLDGEDNFALAVQTARRLTRGHPREALKHGLIVAIDSGPIARRILDYTPAVPGYAIPEGRPAHGQKTGGAEAFLSFIETKVRPHIAARWPINTARETLAGHSFGGILALYDLRRHGNFDAYAAISPSLWFADGKALPRERPATARTVILAGSREGGPANGVLEHGEHLAAELREGGADARFGLLEGHTHGTTMLAAMMDIVRLAFGGERSE